MKEDECGFLHPEIAPNICIDCKKCESVCPVIHAVEEKADDGRQHAIYAAWSKDEENRYNSTSGGVFSELAYVVLAQKGAVFGAVYGEDQMVYHTGVRDLEGLIKIRQSKYVQSVTGFSFRDVKQKLKEGVPVLFCGTPCQVAGLKAFLGEEQQNLYTVDFICRGANSPKAYRKWLDMLEDKYHSKISKVWFKNKELGWNRFSTRVDFENGKVYRKDRYHDLFMRGYLEKNLYIRPSCGQCTFKGFSQYADITLADFWGVDKKLDPDKGTSMVIINTEKGKYLFDLTAEKVDRVERTYDEALKGNQMLSHSAWISKWSQIFLKSLDDERFDRAFYKISWKLRLLKWKTRIIFMKTMAEFLPIGI